MVNHFVLPRTKLQIKLSTTSLLMSTPIAKSATSFWHLDMFTLLFLPLWSWVFMSCHLHGRHRFHVPIFSLPTLCNTMLGWMTKSTWIIIPQVRDCLIMLTIIKRRIGKNMTIIPSMLIVTWLWSWLAFTTTIDPNGSPHVKELSAMLISRWRQKCLNDAFLGYISHAFNYAFVGKILHISLINAL